MSDRLPTALYVDGHLKTLTANAKFYHFIQKGNPGSGIVMLKINALNGHVKLIIQERDFITDQMQWVAALEKEIVEETHADAYIQRAISRDPDLWVIEIEDKEMENPFS
ncbi:MAG: DUF1491 family protein [Bdellovibrionales bacterium]